MKDSTASSLMGLSALALGEATTQGQILSAVAACTRPEMAETIPQWGLQTVELPAS